MRPVHAGHSLGRAAAPSPAALRPHPHRGDVASAADTPGRVVLVGARKPGHASPPTHARARMKSCMHIHVHIHVHTHVCALHADTPTPLTCTCAFPSPCGHAPCMHTRVPCAHTCTHTHLGTHSRQTRPSYAALQMPPAHALAALTHGVGSAVRGGRGQLGCPLAWGVGCAPAGTSWGRGPQQLAALCQSPALCSALPGDLRRSCGLSKRLLQQSPVWGSCCAPSVGGPFPAPRGPADGLAGLLAPLQQCCWDPLPLPPPRSCSLGTWQQQSRAGNAPPCSS